MGRNAYYPARQGDQTFWLVNFANKQPGQATALGLAAAQVTPAVADCGWSAWLNSCDIQADRGDGKGFTLLTIDATPNHTDKQTFPAPLTKWTYQGNSRVDDCPAGLWSNPVSVTVPA
jgi:hypothetical protein